MNYITTIGLEIHAELATRTKMFCSCLNSPFDSAPNSNVCEVCLALPGSLPRLNKQAIEWTIDLGFDVGAKVAEFTKWDRKNYFYPDLPKGYQLSQYDLPLLEGGAIEFADLDGNVRKVNLTRIHLEEDTGKLIHSGSGESQIDYNRAGVPLLELVSEPEISSAEEAKRFCQTYQFILQRRGISRADMEKGEMRCEANISVRPEGQAEFGTKVEVKNLNSFRSVERAIKYEVERQIQLLKSGESVSQETRGWNEAKQQTYVQRSKETAAEYRYFPEPDLPPITPGVLWDLKKKSRAALPQPHLMARDLVREYQLPTPVAELFASDASAFAYFSELINEVPDQKDEEKRILATAAKMYANVDSARNLTPTDLLELSGIIEKGILSQSGSREVIKHVIENGITPNEAVAKLGLSESDDQDEIVKAVEEIISENLDTVQRIQNGEMQVLGFLVGQVMKKLGGRANPAKVSQVLRDKMDL